MDGFDFYIVPRPLRRAPRLGAPNAAVTMAISADRAAFGELLLAWLRIGGPRPHAFEPVGIVTVTGG